ncbi:MAG TPA: M67 family metallopeptidase [Candidatus Binatia bacterium]|nr:M67 family metallopeptidase [Candidatus Binatia bacterium]
MDTTNPLTLSNSAVEHISKHARETFPEECCGVVFSDGILDRAQPLTNIQNRLHALDPETYPRTAAIAYAMDPKELERVIQQAELAGSKLKAFYHSHPDHDAYFSDEDKAFATPFGEPTFPGTAQIVVSIDNRVIKQICAFVWSETNRDFVEVPLIKE